MPNLFGSPIQNFINARIHEAQSSAENLSDAQLQAPNLAGVLENISKLNFQVATLRPDQKKGKRRTERRTKKDYGQQVAADVDVIDVSIPFDGWPRSFDFAPTSGRLSSTKARVEEGMIVASFDDDENLERNVDEFIKLTSENLTKLARDLGDLQKRMLQEAQTVANRRIEQIKSRKERDKSRSFPIE